MLGAKIGVRTRSRQTFAAGAVASGPGREPPLARKRTGRGALAMAAAIGMNRRYMIWWEKQKPPPRGPGRER